MAISTNQKPAIYRNLYEKTGPGFHPTKNLQIKITLTSSRLQLRASQLFKWKREKIYKITIHLLDLYHLLLGRALAM